MTLRNAICSLLAAALLAMPQETDKQLEAAIHTEMVKGDLKGAIAQYRKIVAQSGTPRAVAARALYQLGQCQEKLGQAEARKAYERLVNEYGDTEFASKARVKLAMGEPQAQPKTVQPARVDRHCGMPSEDGRVAACRYGGELFLRELATGQDRRILARPADKEKYISGYELSPDGAKVAYLLDSEKKGSQIRIVNSDGSGDHLILDETAHQDAWVESWSADSRQFVAGIVRKPQGDRRMVLISAGDASARILDPEGSDGEFKAVLSPDGRYIAYRFRPKDAYGKIYVAALNGGPGRLLFSGAAAYGPKAWLRDGRLVFASNRSGTHDLWAVRMEDVKPDGEPELLYKNLGISATGGRMDLRGSYYYSADVSTRKRDIYKALLDGSSAEPALVTPRYFGMSSAPAYSPDGKFLAYSSGPGGSRRIYVRNLEAGSETSLDPPGYPIRLAWYPDGSALLVFAQKPASPPPGVFAFYRLDLKTHASRDVPATGLTGDGALNPSFSPDGRYIYFKVHKKDNNCIARLDLQASRQEDVFCGNSERYVRLFALSPDGTQLVFGGRKPDDSDHIGIVPVSGGEPKIVYQYDTSKPRPMRAWSGLAWTADGKGILFHIGQDGRADDLWLLSLSDGSTRKVASTGMIYTMAVHPNGKEVALDSETGIRETEKWVLEDLLSPVRASR